MKLNRIKGSIPSRLVMTLLLVVAALIAAVSLTVSYLLTHSYERQAKTEIERATASIRQAVSGFVGGAYSLCGELAANPSVLTMDPEIQVPILKSSVERNGYMELLYIQGVDGVQTARSDGQSGGKRGERFWFLQMLEHKRPFVSKSYRSLTTQEPCASIFFPMFKDGSMVGVLGMDIKLEYLRELVTSISDSGAGRYSFVIDGDGQVLAHPGEGYAPAVKKFARYASEKKEGDTADTQSADPHTVVPFEMHGVYRTSISKAMAGESGTETVTYGDGVYYISYAPISLPGHSDTWSVITRQDKAAAMRSVSSLIWSIITIALITAVLAVLAFIVIVGKTVSGPVRALTEAARKISRGDFDAEIPGASKSGDEINVMASALGRMVEQLRIHVTRETQAQTVTAVRLQFALFIAEAQTVPQAFRMTAAVLRYQYERLKITAVYANPYPVYALTFKDGAVSESEDYAPHPEVTALTAGKRVVFLNSFAIKTQQVKFTEHDTQVVCAVPLAVNGKTAGYIILESNERDGISITKDEAFLTETADELSKWLSAHRGAPVTFAETIPTTVKSIADANAGNDGNGTVAALRGFEDMDVDIALDAMGGLEDLYERTVRLFVKLLPETLEKIDGFLGKDMKAFSIEVHGVKGSLNNIGAEIWQDAERLEKAAKSGDGEYCANAYPIFKEELLGLRARILGAIGDRPDNENAKPNGDRALLRDKLEKAKTAADGFDTFAAKDIIKEIAEFTYGSDTDEQIGGISDALDRFDIDSAAKLIDKLKGSLS